MTSKETALEPLATLMYELEDAEEHLTSLIYKMNSDAEYEEVNLRIDLGPNSAQTGRSKCDKRRIFQYAQLVT